MHSTDKLDDKEKEFLLGIARLAIKLKLDGESFNLYNIPYKRLREEKRGVFVTLTKDNQLRGCIGNIEPLYSIYDGVVKNAISAAFNDPRFKPLSKEEINEIKIEISILTPLVKIESGTSNGILESIKEFKHGIYIEHELGSATFLPQVWEHYAKKEDFLNHLCLKANLLPGMWHDQETCIYLYEVIKFKE